ncbi:kinesin-domain-containing protein [Gigaspora margarita]|uniref:Kinesin-like protein n=1 Tax=Gigaspora margarita TaxID=4874 RepID=A0A8H4AE01_GIGMA|nr:kinesin-domain-containing protein [Gigaspora margarita]
MYSNKTFKVTSSSANKVGTTTRKIRKAQAPSSKMIDVEYNDYSSFAKVKLPEINENPTTGNRMKEVSCGVPITLEGRKAQHIYHTRTPSLKRKNDESLADELQRNIRSFGNAQKDDITKTSKRSTICCGSLKKLASVRTNQLDSFERVTKHLPPKTKFTSSEIEVMNLRNEILRAKIELYIKEQIDALNKTIQLQDDTPEVEYEVNQFMDDYEEIDDRSAYKNVHMAEIKDSLMNIRQYCEAMQTMNANLNSEELNKNNTPRSQKKIMNNHSKLNKKPVKEHPRRNFNEQKGNIKVFCRVRPPVLSECEDIADIRFPPYSYGKKISLASIKRNYWGVERETFKEYKFDKVFGASATQEEIFNNVTPIVQSVVDGSNGCIFAYGQTCAGKTYTMQGPQDPTIYNEGMIPRAVRQIFNHVNELKTQGWEYEIEGQFIEIYNDNIRDLLSEDPSNNRGLKFRTIHDEQTGTTMVNKAKTVNLDSVATLNWVLQMAAKNRAVASTKSNANSSRSHSIFMVRLMGTNTITGENRIGTLNLVDLAGSERLSKSGSQGDQLQEARYINSSLSHLKTVIQGIKEKSDHINFRNSTLTWLLKNSLRGNAKVLMFVHISPLESARAETESSLEFARLVNSV